MKTGDKSKSEARVNYISLAFFTVLTLLPLAVGVFAYILFRQDTLIAFLILRCMHFDKLITPQFTDAVKMYMSQKSSWLLYFSKNYISDYCWAFSLEMCIIFALQSTDKGIRNSVLISIGFLAFVEFLQVFPLVPGTFDILDIVCETVAVLIAALTVCIHIINKN